MTSNVPALTKWQYQRRHNAQHEDIQHNGNPFANRKCDTQLNHMLSVAKSIMLSVVRLIINYAEYRK